MGEVVARAVGRDLKDVPCMAVRVSPVSTIRPPSAATIRGGDVVGDHTVLFAGIGERIEITHKSSSRATYAQGSLRAVRFLAHQPHGLFGMDDVLGLKPTPPSRGRPMQALAPFWQQADTVGRAVALVLLMMSISTWAVIFWKAWLLARARRDLRVGTVAFWRAADLASARSALQTLDRDGVLLPLVDAVQGTPRPPALLA